MLPTSAATSAATAGAYYDELSPGQRFTEPPACTLDAGTAAVYRSICGDHWAPGLDHRLAAAITGDARPLANPALVLAISIGASTVATRRVIANLFYRDLVLARPTRMGETLRTTTEVLAMHDASTKPGGAPRGKVLLGITTTADDDVVLAFERCALLPCRGHAAPGHTGDIGTSVAELDLRRYVSAVPTNWDLTLLGSHDGWDIGARRIDPLRDVVDNATALVRLTHNLAAVHRDATATPTGRRLVYGGHTVALAQASLERSLDGLATLIGWHECNHIAATFEGDLLEFDHTLVAQASVGRATLRAIKVRVTAHRTDTDPVEVLDWTPIVYTT